MIFIGGGGGLKRLCARSAHHEHEDLKSKVGVQGPLKGLEALESRVLDGLSCYLSLILKHSYTKRGKTQTPPPPQKKMVDLFFFGLFFYLFLLGGGGGGAPVAPPPGSATDCLINQCMHKWTIGWNSGNNSRKWILKSFSRLDTIFNITLTSNDKL